MTWLLETKRSMMRSCFVNFFMAIRLLTKILQEKSVDFHFLGEDVDPDEMRAALGGVATGLAEQLTTITQEVNKIREELYGDNGIGGIAQELEKMKAGSLGSLLEDTDLTGIPGISEGRDGLRQRPATEARPAKGGGRGLPNSLERERRLEELRRRIEDRHAKEKKPEGLGFMEWLVILFVIFVVAYTALPSFRLSVKQTFQELVLGEVPEPIEEEIPDLGAVVAGPEVY
ncbi:unnamed protein product [Symbiodinium pilosum]|uniref:Uncharacterized protein n=1 Tax=Symbiodinium pilosum TaxID=2952 RepID=A0A812Q6N8_SYMPI|nr:unnamed protein product [Symbiodinium pilosum]